MSTYLSSLPFDFAQTLRSSIGQSVHKFDLGRLNVATRERNAMNSSGYVRWFKDIRLEDVPLVGGKTASLGELYSTLAPEGVRVPNGFALTAAAYRDALTRSGAWDKLGPLLAGIDKRRISDLARRAAAARAIVYAATDLEDLRHEVALAYRQLEREYGGKVAV